MICKPISQILSKMLSFNNLKPDDLCAFGYYHFSRRLSAILTQPLHITYAVSFIVHLYFFKFGLFQIWALFGKASSLKRRFCVCFRWLDCFIDYIWRGLQHFNFGYGLCGGSIDESESQIQRISFAFVFFLFSNFGCNFTTLPSYIDDIRNWLQTAGEVSNNTGKLTI